MHEAHFPMQITFAVLSGCRRSCRSGDEAARPSPDIHCWDSTADAKPRFDKETGLSPGRFAQGNRHRGLEETKDLGRHFLTEATLFHSMFGDLASRGREQSPPLLLPVGNLDGTLSDIIYGLQTSQQIASRIPTAFRVR